MSWVITPSFTQWTPALISTALWLDADDETTVFSDAGTTQATNGAAVQQWNDKSGNAKNFTGSSTARPAYATNSINGKAAILFDGVNDLLGAASAVIPLTHSLFVVFNPTLEDVTGVVIGQWASGQSGRYLWTMNQTSAGSTSSGNFNIFNSTASAGVGAGAGAIETQITNTATLIGCTHKTGTESTKHYKFGTEYESVTITAIYTGNNTGIGSTSASGTSFYYDGSIAEIVMTASVVDVGIRQKIEGYLAHKWGLTANLANTHPYKHQIPTPGV